LNFQDRQVVVTGGTGALGAAVVEMLISAGAHCVVPWMVESELKRFARRDDPRVKLIQVPTLSDEAAVARLYAAAADLWASIHVVGGFAMAPVADTDKAALTEQIDMNFVTSFLCCSAAVRAMAKRKAGRIVNVAARPALEWRAGAGMAAYAASKAAVAALTVALAEEVAKDGILVNAVAPSIMNTHMNLEAMPKADHASWPKVEEVAATIAFLASPENKVTRGAVVPVYGRA
jgi:NAD(P)-dependent dehydrogenase (short-subunit alcohol dehydrogenase family)